MTRRILAPPSRRPTKAQVTTLLLDLGFERMVIRGSHLSFKRGACIICVTRQRVIMDAVIVGIGHQLVMRGLMSQAKWTRWINGR